MNAHADLQAINRRRPMKPRDLDDPQLPSTAEAHATNAPAAPRKRIVQLDGLRALAFFAVFLGHAFAWPLMWVGVDLFFVLSGYLITDILLRRRGSKNYFKQFYYRRFLRIFPPYYFVLLLAFVFLDPKWGEHWYWYVFYLSNIQDAFVGGGSAILRPMWSLAVEEQFYLIWPVVVFWAGRAHISKVAAAFLVLAPLTRMAAAVVSPTHWAAYELLPSRMDLLAIGALLAAQQLKDPAFLMRCRRWVVPVFITASTLFLALVLTVPSFRTGANSLSFNSVGYSCLCLLMAATLVASLTFGWLKTFLSIPPLVFVGKISYMAYLSHQAFLHLAQEVVPSIWSRAGLGLVLTIGWSTLTWHFMEKPLLTLKNRAFNTRS
jgi:peptidoglycan/LPS O-acetylase OafA/YrhL